MSYLKTIAFFPIQILFPFQGFIIKTNLDPNEAKRHLSVLVEPRRFSINPFSASSSKRYEGQISDNQFKISRIITYRNSFLPVFRGKIYTTDENTFIRFTARLHLLIIIILTVWYGFGASLFFHALSEINQSGFPFVTAVVVLFALIFCFPILGSRVGFYLELDAETKFLRKLFYSANAPLAFENKKEKLYNLAAIQEFNPTLEEVLDLKEWAIIIGGAAGISLIIMALS